MKLTTIGSLFAVVLLASCSSSSGEKKIMVLTKNGSSIDEAAKTITASNSGGSESKELLVVDGNKVTYQVKVDGKDTPIDIPTNGYYFLNATKDTIVGSYVVYGAPKTTRDTISQEMIKRSIDSLKQLIENKNVSAANKNFFIAPFSAVKVSDNSKSIVIAPYHQMTSIEKEEGKDPEVYRFYTADEIREKIAKQTEATIAKPKTDEGMKVGNGGKKS